MNAIVPVSDSNGERVYKSLGKILDEASEFCVKHQDANKTSGLWKSFLQDQNGLRGRCNQLSGLNGTENKYKCIVFIGYFGMAAFLVSGAALSLVVNPLFLLLFLGAIASVVVKCSAGEKADLYDGLSGQAQELLHRKQRIEEEIRQKKPKVEGEEQNKRQLSRSSFTLIPVRAPDYNQRPPTPSQYVLAPDAALWGLSEQHAEENRYIIE